MARLSTCLLPLLVACSSRGVSVEAGSFSGDGAALVVEPGGGCGGGPTVRAWGPTWGTNGAAPAQVEADGRGGVWLTFPLRTGLGEAEAAVHVLGDVATLPLGARAGEHDVRLKRAPWPSDEEMAAQDQRIGAAVAAELEAWSLGHFLLKDQGVVAGELQLQGDRAVVSVFDPIWLTPEPAPAQLRSDGPDLVLTFPVEPSFQGELGVLRVNVPSRTAVVPADQEPTELDRHLQVADGALSVEERASVVAQAVASADALEAAGTGELARKLAAAARTVDGECRDLSQLDPGWGLLFAGYDVDVSPGPTGCDVRVSPRIVQQGRRLKANFRSE